MPWRQAGPVRKNKKARGIRRFLRLRLAGRKPARQGSAISLRHDNTIPGRFAARGGSSASVTYIRSRSAPGDPPHPALPCGGLLARRGKQRAVLPGGVHEGTPDPAQVACRGFAAKGNLCVTQGANDGRDHAVDGMTPAFGKSTWQMPEVVSALLARVSLRSRNTSIRL